MSFKLPPMTASPDGAWGPPTNAVPEALRHIPYAPYSKGEKLGRIADWNANAGTAGGPHAFNDPLLAGSQARRFGGRMNANGSQGYREANEDDFSLVDSKAGPTRRPMTNFRGGRGGPQRGAARGGAAYAPGRQAYSGARGGQTSGRPVIPNALNPAAMRLGWQNRDQRVKESSVRITPAWKLLEEIDFSRLSKFTIGPQEPPVEELSQHGTLYTYKRSMERINTKQPERLQMLERQKYNPTTSDDPIIQDMISQGSDAQIFATDSIIALLMTAARSVQPWDITIHKEGPAGSGKVFFDKREGGPFDFITVNENIAEAPSQAEDPLNAPDQLSLEATYLNHNFLSNAVDEAQPISLGAANPFYSSADEHDPPASAGYKYRQYDLAPGAENPMKIVLRTEVDAINKISDSKSEQILIKALNEWEVKGPTGLDWRSKLDTQPGAIFTDELKSNASKIARWAAQGLLSSADQIKIGYISRTQPRDNSKHIILGTQWVKPRELAMQLNLRLDNAWGIVRTFAQEIYNRDEGKYVLVRNPNKPVLELYAVSPEPEEEVASEEDQ